MRNASIRIDETNYRSYKAWAAYPRLDFGDLVRFACFAKCFSLIRLRERLEARQAATDATHSSHAANRQTVGQRENLSANERDRALAFAKHDQRQSPEIRFEKPGTECEEGERRKAE